MLDMEVLKKKAKEEALRKLIKMMRIKEAKPDGEEPDSSPSLNKMASDDPSEPIQPDEMAVPSKAPSLSTTEEMDAKAERDGFMANRGRNPVFKGKSKFVVMPTASNRKIVGKK